MAEAFLTYLTVFKSRLALMNLVLPECGLVHQTQVSLDRKLKRRISQQVPLRLAMSENSTVFEYLQEKMSLSATPRRSGRYKGISLENNEGVWKASSDLADLPEIDVYVVDIMMSDSRLRSTIGTPTEDNSSEVIEMAQQLDFLTRSKNTLTGSGTLFNLLRAEGKTSEEFSDNPFVLGLEATILLRQVVDRDILIIREVIREILNLSTTFSLTEVKQKFDSIVQRAVDSAKTLVGSPSDRQELISFKRQVAKTVAKRSKQSEGPGLLEHRVSPRLEWLTDLGYLSKDGLKKNGFVYTTEPSLQGLLDDLDSATELRRLGSSIAISQWSKNPIFEYLRRHVGVRTTEYSIRDAYVQLRRPIGPIPIQDLAFIACLYSGDSVSFDKMIGNILTLATDHQGIALSGGRYSRLAENIFIPDSVIDAL